MITWQAKRKCRNQIAYLRRTWREINKKTQRIRTKKTERYLRKEGKFKHDSKIRKTINIKRSIFLIGSNKVKKET